MEPWIIPCIALVAFTAMLSCVLRRFRSVAGYRKYWVTMVLLSLVWLVMGAISGRDLYRFAGQDFSGPAGNVGMFLIFVFVAWSIFVVPNVAIFPSLFFSLPRNVKPSPVGRKRMILVVGPIIAFQATMLCLGCWAMYSGVWHRALSL